MELNQTKECNVTLLLILLSVCIAPCLLKCINGPDVWFHMACGKDMLATGTVDVSKFYYTAVNMSINDFKFTWLGDIILYLVHFVGGPVGLQILRVECIALMLYFMWMVSDRRVNIWKCLVCTLVVYGTAQLQVVRNSIASMVFLCALWYVHVGDTKYKHLWSIVVLVFWSQIHGSVLLGYCMYGLLAIRSVKSLILVVGIVLTTNYVLPLDVFDYLRLPTSFNLNRLVFQSGDILSKDFCSPFRIERHYTAMMLVLSLMHIVLIKRVRWFYVVPFLATLVPALGYVRMVGYQAITCGMCLMYAERMGDLRVSVNPRILLVLLVMVGGYGWKYNNLTIGVGVSPLYTSVANQEVTRNVLTQDYLTSYLYFNHGVKGFFSTFHAPHPRYVYDAYQTYMGDPDTIDNSINTCIIEDRVYADRFFKSKSWIGSKQGHVYIFNRRGVM